MPNLNKIMLIGNLTRDPISRAIASGSSVCEFGLAVNRRFRTAQGEDREEVCFVDIEVWGKTGDNCNRFLHKGSPVYVEGRLRMDQWVDKTTNQQRSRLRVVADTVTFLETRASADDMRGGASAYNQQMRGNDVPPIPPEPEMPDDEFGPSF